MPEGAAEIAMKSKPEVETTAGSTAEATAEMTESFVEEWNTWSLTDTLVTTWHSANASAYVDENTALSAAKTTGTTNDVSSDEYLESEANDD